MLSIRLNQTARGLAPLYASTLIAGIGWTMILPILPVIASEFDVSLGSAAQIVTAFGVGKLIGTPISGIMVDRLGSRLTLVLGPAIAVVAAGIAAMTPWFLLILVTSAAIGLGDSIWAIGREISGIDIVKPHQRGRMLSGFHGLHTTGMAVGPAFGGILSEAIDFRAVFVAFAIVSALAVVLGAISHNAKPPQQAAVSHDRRVQFNLVIATRSLVNSFINLLRQIQPAFRATYAVLVFATFSSFLFRMGVQSMLPLYASAELGLSPSETGFLFSISGGLVFVMILPAGFIIDKVGRKWATVPSTGLPFVAFMLIPFTDSFAQLAVLISLVGMANGLSLGSLASSTYDIAPAGARGQLQATRRTIAETGGIAAPLAGGILADAYGPGVAFFVFAPFLLVGALLLAFVAKETLVKQEAGAGTAPAKS